MIMARAVAGGRAWRADDGDMAISERERKSLWALCLWVEVKPRRVGPLEGKATKAREGNASRARGRGDPRGLPPIEREAYEHRLRRWGPTWPASWSQSGREGGLPRDDEGGRCLNNTHVEIWEYLTLEALDGGNAESKDFSDDEGSDLLMYGGHHDTISDALCIGDTFATNANEDGADFYILRPKKSILVKWPIPQSVSEVRGFLGLTGWCRIFIQDYALISKPLTELTQIDENFIWTEKRDFAFNELKNLLAKSPVLKLPDFEKTFEVIADACAKGVGGILRHEGHRIAYESRQLRIHEQNYPTHDLELLAVVHALKKWRHYLLSQIFELVTDHKNLKWIFTQPELNMRQRRWVEFLQEFNFKIKF
ncbi:hypothetical protein L7F22_005349 [Adiantum nelumboides]|nr:hypothetical protein [Adiantum nelumboides]